MTEIFDRSPPQNRVPLIKAPSVLASLELRAALGHAGASYARASTRCVHCL